MAATRYTEIGRGQYGVVYADRGRPGTVLKTFADPGLWEQEVHALQLVRDLDPGHVFTPKVFELGAGDAIRYEHAGTDFGTLLRQAAYPDPDPDPVSDPDSATDHDSDSDSDPNDGPITTPRQWLDIRVHVLDVLRGVDAFANAGVLHNDIKFENLMRTPTGRGVLVDFGLLSRGPRADMFTTGKFSWWLPPDCAVFWCVCMSARHPHRAGHFLAEVVHRVEQWRACAQERCTTIARATPPCLDVDDAEHTGATRRQLRAAVKALAARFDPREEDGDGHDADEDDDAYMARMHARLTASRNKELAAAVLTSDVYSMGLVLATVGRVHGLEALDPIAAQATTCNMFQRPSSGWLYRKTRALFCGHE